MRDVLFTAQILRKSKDLSVSAEAHAGKVLQRHGHLRPNDLHKRRRRNFAKAIGLEVQNLEVLELPQPPAQRQHSVVADAIVHQAKILEQRAVVGEAVRQGDQPAAADAVSVQEQPLQLRKALQCGRQGLHAVVADPVTSQVDVVHVAQLGQSELRQTPDGLVAQHGVLERQHAEFGTAAEALARQPAHALQSYGIARQVQTLQLRQPRQPALRQDAEAVGLHVRSGQPQRLQLGHQRQQLIRQHLESLQGQRILVEQQLAQLRAVAQSFRKRSDRRNADVVSGQIQRLQLCAVPQPSARQRRDSVVATGAVHELDAAQVRQKGQRMIR
mmetsp:Transcript_2951/g.11963  ORF Transcript_2951/g.11963 Transcript_2951/m.11963 type:complete len:329 (+) Transcript_2951:830-1816(+)|eukprot:scaffold1311_cov256-Pinguiococcus_pyrenoidosus.AAC.27